MLNSKSSIVDVLSNLRRNIRRVQEVIDKQISDDVENAIGFTGGLDSDEAKIKQTRFMAEEINQLPFTRHLNTKLAEIEASCGMILNKHRREDLLKLKKLLVELNVQLFALSKKKCAA